MAFDYKKEYREFYLPPRQPELVRIPSMNFAAVRGEGDPNQEDGAYKEAIGLLYGVAFTIKMSKRGDRRIDGYFDYVVPPLEGFWWMDGGPDGEKLSAFFRRLNRRRADGAEVGRTGRGRRAGPPPGR